MSSILHESSLLSLLLASLPCSIAGEAVPVLYRAPPVLVHLNAFQILMGCSVLNSLYQLYISLVKICFIYTLRLGTGGHLSMSAHSP